MCEPIATKGGGNSGGYVIAGTNTSYTGMVLQINDQYFSTTTGAMEGDSKELKLVDTRSSTNNPIVGTFNAPPTPRYYRPNGTIVPVGAPLHEHSGGKIMTGHSMGSNSVAVTTVGREASRDMRIRNRTSRIQNARRTRSRTPRSQRTTTPRTRNGMNGDQNQRQRTRTTNRTTRTRTTTQQRGRTRTTRRGGRGGRGGRY